MASVTWLSAVSGDWSVGTLWNTGAAPGSLDTALIQVPGSYDVTIANSENLFVGAVAVSAGTLTVTGLLHLQSSTTMSSVGSGATLDGSGVLSMSAATTLTNAGVIAADATGFLQVFAGTLVNTGTLLASAGTLNLNSPVITNLVSGTLTGGSYVALGSSGGSEILLLPEVGVDGRVVTDAATIVLSGANSALQGYDVATKSVEPIEASLTSVAASGVLDVLAGRNYATANTLSVAGSVGLGGGTLALGGLTLAAGGNLAGYGTVSGSLTDGGTIAASSGVLSLVGAVTGAGTLAIAAGATLAASGSLAAGLNVGFTGHFDSAVLDLGAPTQTGAAISGFVLTDTIDAQGFAGTAPVWSGNTLTLTGTGAQTGQTLTLDVAGSYAGAHFSAVSDGSGGTDIGVSCFVAGTRIRTARGDVAVERLAVGDILPTGNSAGPQPVVWVGRRRIDCARHKLPHMVMPVRVCAGAFGDAQPTRDLRLSPDHAVFLWGKLIPIRCLVNGTTIRQETVKSVTYYHVELPLHAVLFAEGLPAESYLDLGNRNGFENGGAAVTLHPDFYSRIWEAKSCAELIFGGPVLAAARGRLLLQAQWLGHACTTESGLHLRVDGRTILPETNGQAARFLLPSGTARVRLCSQVCIPGTVSWEQDDVTDYGVAVAALLLDRRTVACTDQRLGAGWHTPEADLRWTDGDAEIIVDGARELIVQLAGTGQYWAAPQRVHERRQAISPPR